MQSTDDQNTPDLSGLDEEFAGAPAPERNFGAIPDGKYQVRVEKAELVRTRTTGNPMLKWTLRILGPTHANRVLFRNSVLASSENLSWMKADLRVCGIQLQKLSDLPAHLESLLDLELEVSVRNRGENVNIYFNRLLDDAVSGESSPGGGNTSNGGRGSRDGLPF
jgi:hypothetical protein